MSLKQNLCHLIVGRLPPTRAYRLKAWLFRQAGVRISANARMTSSVKIWGTLNLSVGDDSFLGHEVLIAGGNSRVTIGNNVDIAPRVTILTGTHKVDMIGAHSAGAGCSQDIAIQDGAWIGAGSTILAGVTIGQKTIVAAGSMVTKDIPPFTLAAGVPCKPKKTWSPVTQRWFRYQQEAGEA